MNLTRKNIKNFLAKFRQGNKRDCWEWMASKNNKGYGEFGVDGKMQKAHRVSYSYFVEDIPKGLHVMHSCDNAGCVNPHHLDIGTNQDNVNDKVRKGRHRHSHQSRESMSRKHADVKGENNPFSKLNDNKVLQMRALYQTGGYTYKKIGCMFDVHWDTARSAILGITWSHLY